MATAATALPRFGTRGIARTAVAAAVAAVALLQLLGAADHAVHSLGRAGLLVTVGSVQAATAVAVATTRGRAALMVAFGTLVVTLALSFSAASAAPSAEDAPPATERTMSPADYLHRHGDHLRSRP